MSLSLVDLAKSNRSCVRRQEHLNLQLLIPYQTIDINAKLDSVSHTCSSNPVAVVVIDEFDPGERAPIFYDQPTNIIGLVLVKNLLTIHPEDEEPFAEFQRSQKVFHFLNEFQKGQSHMAVVVRQHHNKSPASSDVAKEVRVDVDGDDKLTSLKSNTSLQSFPNTGSGSFRRIKTCTRTF